jgi:hypothetical protein
MNAGSRIDLIDNNPRSGPMDEPIWVMDGSRPMGRKKTGRRLSRWTCTFEAPEGRGRNRTVQEAVRVLEERIGHIQQPMEQSGRIGAGTEITRTLENSQKKRQKAEERRGKKRNETKRNEKSESKSH